MGKKPATIKLKKGYGKGERTKKRAVRPPRADGERGTGDETLPWSLWTMYIFRHTHTELHIFIFFYCTHSLTHQPSSGVLKYFSFYFSSFFFSAHSFFSLESPLFSCSRWVCSFFSSTGKLLFSSWHSRPRRRFAVRPLPQAQRPFSSSG